MPTDVWSDAEVLFLKRVGSRIEAIRTQRKLSLESVAHSMGIARTTQMRREKGEISFLTVDLRRYCELFGVTIQTLMKGTYP